MSIGVRQLALTGWLAGCTAAAPVERDALAVTPASAPAATTTDFACQITNTSAPSTTQRAAIQAMQRQALQSPLFGAVAGAGVARCTLQLSAEDQMTLTLRMRDGSVMQVQADPRIEQHLQVVQFAQPGPASPLPLLAAAERAAYGETGCGIDWQTPESRRPTQADLASEQVYHGDACNCQAVVGRDAHQVVRQLTLGSAC